MHENENIVKIKYILGFGGGVEKHLLFCCCCCCAAAADTSHHKKEIPNCCGWHSCNRYRPLWPRPWPSPSAYPMQRGADPFSPQWDQHRRLALPAALISTEGERAPKNANGMVDIHRTNSQCMESDKGKTEQVTQPTTNLNTIADVR